jgi:hypothetical protein
MSGPRVSDTSTLLRLLRADGIDFVVVGMAAAVLQGVPTTTQDLDIVHSRAPDNVQRLLAALLRIGAHQRADLASRRLPPTAELLSGQGHLNLQTRHGPLDVLCELDAGRGYDELLSHTEEV